MVAPREVKNQPVKTRVAPDMYKSTQPFEDDYVNPRGIPRVDFVEDIGAYIKQRGVTVDTIIHGLQEQHSKYKLMEHRLTQNQSQLKGTQPEITKNLDLVKMLMKKNADQEEFNTHFGLTDLVFGEARVPPTATVHLWLGANVMVEFTLAEAQALLEKNKASAQENLDHATEDLAWLRDQQVICEVNTSRIFNFDVVRRRDEAEAAAAK
jgi:prefoldin subunit 5